MSIEQEDRDAAIEVLRDTRCIATARLERGFAKPVPEEAALMADALIAAGFSRHQAPEVPDFETMFCRQVEYSIKLQRRLESVGIEPWGDLKESAEWASRHPEPVSFEASLAKVEALESRIAVALDYLDLVWLPRTTRIANVQTILSGPAAGGETR